MAYEAGRRDAFHTDKPTFHKVHTEGCAFMLGKTPGNHCTATATILQIHCNHFAASLQAFCSVTATVLQQICNGLAVNLQNGCRRINLNADLNSG